METCSPEVVNLLPRCNYAWSSEQLQGSLLESSGSLSPPIHDAACQSCAKVVYLFALTVLRDVKEISGFYAVAVAKYDTVKIIVG